MCVDLWALTPGAACAPAGAPWGSDKAQGKWGAAIVKMSLKSQILGRVAGENEIDLFVCGSCTAPSVIFVQTLWVIVPIQECVEGWIHGQQHLQSAQCLLGCAQWRNEGWRAFPGAQLLSGLHSPKESSVPLCSGVVCVHRLLLGFSWCFYKPGACLG